jgi:predicted metal-binding protein
MIMMIFNILLICIISITNVKSIETSLGSIFNADDWVPIEEPIYNTIERPPQVISNTYNDINTEIFISIVEYRDSRCPLTLFNIFTKASNPNRIMIGLIKQVHTEEDSSDCVKAFCLLMKKKKCPYKDQIRNIEMSYLESRGPTNARHMTQFLLEDEEFCMQIDSHSDFISGWDVAMTKMWGSINNEYAILSTKPPDISTLNKVYLYLWISISNYLIIYYLLRMLMKDTKFLICVKQL